ncbi:MAG: dihydropteroate synthase [Candidatus Aminicenantes bacterium]|nr:dihydropteroate synthase [Candidatus Aminicenantes bacterium]
MRKEFIFQTNGRTYHLGRRTWLMGIVNVTPDSFYDGGLYMDPDKAVAHGLAMAAEGADILDVGGESSRPSSDPVPADEERRRLVPVVAGLRKQTKALISADTTKFEVAEAALDAGADIINDISSFNLDPRILLLAAKKDAGFILMHMKGMPKTMQVQPYYDDVVGEIRAFLAEKIEIARAYGLQKENVIIDPGIGFGKRHQDNLVLLNSLDAFSGLGRPILIGVSRKSFIGKILNAPPEDRLEGTIAASIVSIVHGAHILRVHDVKAVKRAVLVAEAILNEHPDKNSGEEKVGYAH